MFQSVFELSLEEDLVVPEESALSVKAVVVPIPLISETAVELIDPETTSDSLLKGSIVAIPILVDSSSLAMR